MIKLLKTSWKIYVTYNSYSLHSSRDLWRLTEPSGTQQCGENCVTSSQSPSGPSDVIIRMKIYTVPLFIPLFFLTCVLVHWFFGSGKKQFYSSLGLVIHKLFYFEGPWSLGLVIHKLFNSESPLTWINSLNHSPPSHHQNINLHETWLSNCKNK